MEGELLRDSTDTTTFRDIDGQERAFAVSMARHHGMAAAKAYPLKSRGKRARTQVQCKGSRIRALEICLSIYFFLLAWS